MLHLFGKNLSVQETFKYIDMIIKPCHESPSSTSFQLIFPMGSALGRISN